MESISFEILQAVIKINVGLDWPFYVYMFMMKKKNLGWNLLSLLDELQWMYIY